MTKERLKVMTILDTMFIIAFGYSTIASWGVYESYYTITYFAITVFLMAIMCDRIYCYIHKNVTDKTKEKLKDIFIRASIYELEFWDMAYKGE